MPDIADQYRIITGAAGWRQEQNRGRLRFAGADRAAFLQALVTNEVEALQPGTGTYAAYLTPNGRMISDLHLYVRDENIVAAVPASVAATLAKKLDQLIFSEDVSVADVSAESAQIMIAGGESTRVLAAVLGVAEETLAALPVHGSAGLSGEGFIARADVPSAVPAFSVFLPASAALDVTARLAEAGVLAIDEALFEAMRVNAGVPEYGIDMDETTLPLEAGLLERAISTTKGCYVGQEIVIRVLHRGGGRVAKRLVRLKGESGVTASPARGQKLAFDGRDVGELTSVAPSVDGPGWVGLGYVHRDVAEPGRTVAVNDSEATIVGLVS